MIAHASGNLAWDEFPLGVQDNLRRLGLPQRHQDEIRKRAAKLGNDGTASNWLSAHHTAQVLGLPVHQVLNWAQGQLLDSRPGHCITPSQSRSHTRFFRRADLAELLTKRPRLVRGVERMDLFLLLEREALADWIFKAANRPDPR